MTITLTPEIESALAKQARAQAIAPETLALDSLRERFVPLSATNGKRAVKYVDDLQPRDDWEALVLSIGVETGVSLTDEQTSREVIYEDHD